MMHPNSLEAYRDLTDLGERQMVVYKALRKYGPMTDRECRDVLGYSDMNEVRPRITELLDEGWVKEMRPTRCDTTGRRVRRVRAIDRQERWNDEHQISLF